MVKASDHTGRKLAKTALSRVVLGQSFSERDRSLFLSGIFVETPALRSATDISRQKCFFVGRRGTGKTAIARYMSENFPRTTIEVFPQLFSSIPNDIDVETFSNASKAPFKSLISAFKRALQDEVLNTWNEKNLIMGLDRNATLSREKNYYEDYDFDTRTIEFIDQLLGHLSVDNQRGWIRQSKLPEKITEQMEKMRSGPAADFTVLIDRIDDFWDGSDKAVILLMALMHACLQLSSSDSCVRPLLFLRENIFERVRQIDLEFARIETSVVSMDWTKELLLEMIERRLNYGQTTKLPLDGATWDAYFESMDGHSSREYVFSYCQERPRDIITFCSFAIENAQSRKKEAVTIEDMQTATRRFSESRFKDLGDEYAENYPQLQVVLSKFYGQGRVFTLNGLVDFMQKLLGDQAVYQSCQWIYKYSGQEQFIRLMYDIGFFGIKDETATYFRSLGSSSPTLPTIRSMSQLVIHPSYAEALNLQDKVVGELDEEAILRTSGIIDDLPDNARITDYQNQLVALERRLKELPVLTGFDQEFMSIVESIVKLCFYRPMKQIKVRSDAYNEETINTVMSNLDFGPLGLIEQ